jgi:hypothetical protein
MAVEGELSQSTGLILDNNFPQRGVLPYESRAFCDDVEKLGQLRPGRQPVRLCILRAVIPKLSLRWKSFEGLCKARPIFH